MFSLGRVECLKSAHAGASSDEAQEDQTVLDAQMKVADQVGLGLAAGLICRRLQTIKINTVTSDGSQKPTI